MDEQAGTSSKVRVQLSSRDTELQLPSNTGAILVSTALKRYALSTLVNNLLDNEQAVPFEFLINGTFLRTSIDDYLSAHGLSTESTVNIEYVRALVPPTYSTSFEHDDWVSSIDVYSSKAGNAPWLRPDVSSRDDERILSGSYDGLLRMWTASAKLVATSQPVSAASAGQAIKAARFLTHSRVVTAGNDRTVRVWNYKETLPTSSDNQTTGAFSPALELYGHRSSIDSIAVDEKSERILSASSDHTVGVWSTRKSELPPAPESLLPPNTNKRRKVDQAVSNQTIPRRGALKMLRGHSGPVTDIRFSAKDSTVGYSCAWDHTILTWDLVTGAEVSTRRTMHPLLCLCELDELGVLIVGSTARHLSVVDPRADARDISGMTLRGHLGAVSCVAPEPGKPWGLVSGSHDGTCRIWDLRSVRLNGSTSVGIATGGPGQVCDSVYSIARDGPHKTKKSTISTGVKVFGVQWDTEVGIVSAGEDKRVQINRPIER